MLTASEAADRLQKRRHPKDSKETYTCENCGEHEFIVVRTYDDDAVISRTLACQCDNDEDLAAVFDSRVTHHVTESGVLNDDHRVEWDSSEREVEEDREATDREVKCQRCFSRFASKESSWEESTDDEFTIDAESEVFEVRCAACDHECEFGWSHPDRGGRIWPVESRDFNPWKSIPEARFVGDWRRRGWLRPSESLRERLKEDLSET